MHRTAARKGMLRPLPPMDLPFLVLVLTLVAFGLVMLCSASSAVALYRRQDAFAYVRPQLLYAAMGLGAMWMASRVDYHIYHKLAWPLLALSLVLLTAVVLFATGIAGSSVAALKDLTDTARIALLPGSGWPQQTGVAELEQMAPLTGSFVELGDEGCVVWSRTGKKLNSIQSGYARPALAVGNTRFVLYNRAGKELTVQSRTRQLYAKSFNNAIMLCEMAQNGTLAVVTESDRYAAEVMVYDASFSGDPFTWKLTSTDGTPIALSFATDNHRFAAATVAARDGQLRTTVRMMNTNSDTAGPFYVADTGSVILKLKWISSSRVLAVFDTYAAIINVSDGTESARYDYGGATLQSVSISGRSTALLLAVRGGDTLVTLDDSLNQLASVAAGQAKSVSSTATAVYLLTASGVESYGYDGTHNWSRDYGAAPQAVINARETLVFISGTVEVLNAPHE